MLTMEISRWLDARALLSKQFFICSKINYDVVDVVENSTADRIICVFLLLWQSI